MIELDDVVKVYELGETEVHALNHVTLSIEKEEFVAIVGPSGSGKSTLLNLVGCIDQPSSGRVMLEGQDVTSLKDRELTDIRLRKIGFIFQQFYLIPTLTALENVELPMKEAKVPRAERAERARSLLDRMGLGNRVKHFPNQLSGGEQQRVAIARALANRPHLILADEPTGEVDSKTAEMIVGILKGLNEEEGITVVLVTHDQSMAGYAQRVVKMHDGRIAGTG